ncbi:MAG: hypothetical protein COB61_007015 [Thiotrichales bacterium]|nr:hypothetical protein [Thiotrichales bacterium]
MSNTDNSHPLEGMITDYLNGHLSESDAEKFTAAMAQNNQLREMVGFERNIQATVHAEQPTPSYVPQFSSIADKLDNTSGSWFLRWTAWAPSVAVAILAAVVIGYLPPSVTPINEFETLSDIAINYDKPVIRVINKESLSESTLNSLLSDYGLKVIKRYPSANAMDVVSKQSAQLSDIAIQLKNDNRVKFVQLTEGR